MKLITINPNNERYYSDDFIKGFECGTQRQLEADKADRPTGEWIDDGSYYYWRCSNCNELSCCRSKFCGGCGARMKGADDE